MHEVDPRQTSRATAFKLWMKAPMPMVTLTKTIDVSHLLKLSRKHGLKFTMLMCWCVGKAASQIDEFYLLPVGDKLMRFDKLAIRAVVATKDGSITTCNVPFSEDLQQFSNNYKTLTRQVRESCRAYDPGKDYMMIGTSGLVQTQLDSVINIYAGFYNNPFVIWSKHKKGLFKSTMAVSFQFHHTQMDGGHGAIFLEKLQKEIKQLQIAKDFK